jgi:hypothetical protein
MGGCSSKAESAYTETQLSEFAAQYKNADMPQLRICICQPQPGSYAGYIGKVTTNTSDMPAVLDAIGNMFASLQVPLELKDKLQHIKTKTIGPFSQQAIKLAKSFDQDASSIYMVALSDALEPLGWKYVSEVQVGFSSIMSFTKVGVA